MQLSLLLLILVVAACIDGCWSNTRRDATRWALVRAAATISAIFVGAPFTSSLTLDHAGAEMRSVAGTAWMRPDLGGLIAEEHERRSRERFTQREWRSGALLAAELRPSASLPRSFGTTFGRARPSPCGRGDGGEGQLLPGLEIGRRHRTEPSVESPTPHTASALAQPRAFCNSL